MSCVFDSFKYLAMDARISSVVFVQIWLGVLIPCLEPIGDPSGLDTARIRARDAPGHLGNEPLHLVDPGRIGRVKCETEMLSQQVQADACVLRSCHRYAHEALGNRLSIMTRT